MRSAAKFASPAIVAQCGHSLKSSLRHVYRQMFMLGDSTFSTFRCAHSMLTCINTHIAPIHTSHQFTRTSHHLLSTQGNH